MGGQKTTKSMGAKGRSSEWSFDPDDLVIPTDPSNLLADEERNANVAEKTILQIMRRGIHTPILVRKNGPKYEVINGRQRVLAAREANRRLRAEGLDPVLVPAVTRKVSDAAAYAMMVSTNACVRPETPMSLARKLERYLALGHSEEDAALDFHVDLATVRRWGKLLDLDAKVQGALDAGKISTQVALDLAKLPRDRQVAEMATMVERGTTHGEAGRHAAAKATNGVAPNGRKLPTRTPMRGANFVKRLRAIATPEASRAPAQAEAVREVLAYVLGEIGVGEMENGVARSMVEAAELASQRKGKGSDNGKGSDSKTGEDAVAKKDR